MFIRFVIIEMNRENWKGRSAKGTFPREQIEVINFAPYENDRLGASSTLSYHALPD